ncbi:MAG: hypothetical protein JWM44_2308 [Bacilli bacterium]|nr:hypothetical protein [Bacilli bacterium]
MANSNPYDTFELPNWVVTAIDTGDKKRIERYMRFCIHTKRKFEQCYAREYNRNIKLKEQLAKEKRQ